ncbi:hypothetical protein RhiirA4_474318 [Rhizophagus irregularis]|uniref:Restriction endonuclease domain-containing protein n=1 Tax=Rhizophagus irregularis TaxID=588596 RepID=A0A2I1H870_9GLOM|nr:hypothetical protein RhiirA4_474318 [Rhizophagus irregularis]
MVYEITSSTSSCSSFQQDFIFDPLDANKQAFIECSFIRLPLILMENVTYDEFEKKCERATASKFWEYRDKNVIIIELPRGDHEVAHSEFIRQFIRQDPQDTIRDIGSKTYYSAEFKGLKGSSRQADVSLIPKYLPNLPKYLSDPEGNTWPTIICEIASTQSLKSIIQKTTQFWLAPNRVEDIIIFKLWPSKLGRNQDKNPLRRLTCYKFCRRTSPKDAYGNYQPIQVIEFGTINSDGNPYYGCSTLGSCTLSISPHCIYKGCTYPYPLTDV